MNIVIAQEDPSSEGHTGVQKVLNIGANILKKTTGFVGNQMKATFTPENKEYAKEKITQGAASAGSTISEFGQFTKFYVSSQMKAAFTPENKEYAKEKVTQGVASAGSAISEFGQSAKVRIGEMNESTQRIFHYLKDEVQDVFTGEAPLIKETENSNQEASQQLFASINRYRLYVILTVSGLSLLAWQLYKKISESRKIISEDPEDLASVDHSVV